MSKEVEIIPAALACVCLCIKDMPHEQAFRHLGLAMMDAADQMPPNQEFWQQHVQSLKTGRHYRIEIKVV